MEVFTALFVLVPALLIAWLISEFHSRPWLRVTLGLLAICTCIGLSWLSSSADLFFQRQRSGMATKALVQAVHRQLEAGNYDRIRTELSRLEKELVPIGEQLSQNDARVKETAIRLNETGSPTSLRER